MLVLCYIVSILLFCTLFTYAFLELHYFLRMLLTVFVALFKKKAGILDECSVTGKLALFCLKRLHTHSVGVCYT